VQGNLLGGGDFGLAPLAAATVAAYVALSWQVAKA
jgi:hypothetical protein